MQGFVEIAWLRAVAALVRGVEVALLATGMRLLQPYLYGLAALVASAEQRSYHDVPPYNIIVPLGRCFREILRGVAVHTYETHIYLRGVQHFDTIAYAALKRLRHIHETMTKFMRSDKDMEMSTFHAVDSA